MELTVRDAQDRSRYELLDGHTVVGVADYRLVGDDIVFPHTEIASHLRGQGLGDVLMAGVVDALQGSGRRVVPQCWFVADYLERHPEHADLLVGGPAHQ
ncbi:MAG: GNAT family N-acetyltransferase [Acidimicrobiales bacterium]|nr:GNAT family N-acetyltransferase [Acidimicrobiales bacterium]